MRMAHQRGQRQLHTGRGSPQDRFQTPGRTLQKQVPGLVSRLGVHYRERKNASVAQGKRNSECAFTRARIRIGGGWLWRGRNFAGRARCAPRAREPRFRRAKAQKPKSQKTRAESRPADTRGCSESTALARNHRWSWLLQTREHVRAERAEEPRAVSAHCRDARALWHGHCCCSRGETRVESAGQRQAPRKRLSICLQKRVERWRRNRSTLA